MHNIKLLIQSWEYYCQNQHHHWIQLNHNIGVTLCYLYWERERAIVRSIMKDLMINYLPSFLLCLPRFLLLSANVTFASVPVSSIIVRVSFLAYLLRTILIWIWRKPERYFTKISYSIEITRIFIFALKWMFSLCRK